MGPFTTNEVALYGAILATLTFLFNLWRVMRERPKLQVRIVTTHYDDGGFSKVETTPTGGTASTPIVYFHVEVANIGERPTTLMGVAATTRKAGIAERIHPRSTAFQGERGISSVGFKTHYGATFPHVLKPGEVFSCRVKKDQVLNMRSAGIPKLELHAVHWKDPRLIRFPEDDGQSIFTTK